MLVFSFTRATGVSCLDRTSFVWKILLGLVLAVAVVLVSLASCSVELFVFDPYNAFSFGSSVILFCMHDPLRRPSSVEAGLDLLNFQITPNYGKFKH